MKPAASNDACGPALLVAQTSFLGDVVLTTPLVSALRRRLMPRRLALLVRPEAVPLVAGHPDIDQVLVDDKRGADRGALGWLGTARRLRAEGFEVAVSPHRSLRTALVLAAAGTPRPGRARGGAARRRARAARSRPAGGRGARLGVGDQALGAGGLRGRDRCPRGRGRALRRARRPGRGGARRGDRPPGRRPRHGARRAHGSRHPGRGRRPPGAPGCQRQRAHAHRDRARRPGGGGLLRHHTRARLRAVGSARGRGGGRSRLPPVRPPRRPALPARHRGLHAARRAGGRAGGGPRGARGRAGRSRARMTASLENVAAVVLASRGGACLASALDGVAWAGERIVLDPAGRLGAEPLPDGVRWAEEPAEAARAAWLLLVEEHEAVRPSLVAAIASGLEAPGARAYRIAQEVIAFGTTLRLRHAPVRLARRDGVRLRLRTGLTPELAAGGGRAPRLPERLVKNAVPTLAAAVDELDAQATTLAALLHARRVRPRAWHLVVPPLAASGRALVARGPAGGFWGRWTLAVLGGYRALVAHAQLWELRREEAARRR